MIASCKIEVEFHSSRKFCIEPERAVTTGSDSNNLERKDFSLCPVSEELSPDWPEERIEQLKLWRWECGKAVLSGQPGSIA